MATQQVDVVRLRRHDTSQPWGFRMQGGREYGLPLFIVAVSPKGLAGKAGLRNGDAILQICQTNVQGWAHQDAKSEMMRAGNDVDLYVARGAVNISDPNIKAACGVGGKKRVELDEESINPQMNDGAVFRNVTPKTYKILEAQLAQSEPEPGPPHNAHAPPAQSMSPVHSHPAPNQGGKPSSIFDRKQTERSDYLKAQGQTIQKAYGQQF